MYMSKIDEFKKFVRLHPEFIEQVNANNVSWQSLYELYDMYGEESNVWERYTNNSSKIASSSTKNSTWSDIVNIAKNMDVNKVQEGIVSIQKALGLVSDLFVKDNQTKSEYTPRPLYKHFED